jgi:hypothetical protein
MIASSKSLTVNMRTAIGLLYIFIFAIVVALIITIISVPNGVKILAIGFIIPMVALSLIFVHFCRMRRAWSFAGAAILGAVGAILRVTVSTQPNLEVGGAAFPVGVTVLYVVLGTLLSLKSYESWLELRSQVESPRRT